MTGFLNIRSRATSFVSRVPKVFRKRTPVAETTATPAVAPSAGDRISSDSVPRDAQSNVRQELTQLQDRNAAYVKDGKAKQLSAEAAFAEVRRLNAEYTHATGAERTKIGAEAIRQNQIGVRLNHEIRGMRRANAMYKQEFRTMRESYRQGEARTIEPPPFELGEPRKVYEIKDRPCEMRHADGSDIDLLQENRNQALAEWKTLSITGNKKSTDARAAYTSAAVVRERADLIPDQASPEYQRLAKLHRQFMSKGQRLDLEIQGMLKTDEFNFHEFHAADNAYRTALQTRKAEAPNEFAVKHLGGNRYAFHLDGKRHEGELIRNGSAGATVRDVRSGAEAHLSADNLEDLQEVIDEHNALPEARYSVFEDINNPQNRAVVPSEEFTKILALRQNLGRFVSHEDAALLAKIRSGEMTVTRVDQPKSPSAAKPLTDLQTHDSIDSVEARPARKSTESKLRFMSRNKEFKAGELYLNALNNHPEYIAP